MPDDEGRDDDQGAQPGAGRMRFQDETTVPREPTLAERRAREQAARREEQAQRQRAEDEQRSRVKRKRILVGAGVTVGVVALVAAGYSLAKPDEEVVAQCVDEASGLVVDESNCVTPASTNGTYYGGGGFYPIFIGGGGRQYRYNYGGTGAIGQPSTGGTVVPREGTRVTTPSGRVLSGGSKAGSGSVTRGGLGVSNNGSSGS